MTPDRPDQTPNDDDAENGVLSDTGSLDTSGIGILGGATEQVSVSLPVESDDDDADDDVIGDEVPFAESFQATGAFGAPEPIDAPVDVPVETAEGEIIDDGLHPQDWEPVPFPGEAPARAAAPDIEDAVEVVDDEPGDATDAAPAVPPAPVAPERPTLPRTSSFAAPSYAAPSLSARSAAAASSQASASSPASASTPTVPQPTTGSIPATRREAHLADAESAERPQPARAQAVERVTARPDVALTSKRLGEFEGGRETSDLLTADRLLDPAHVVRSEPEGAWQHFVYSISGHRINLGDSKRARARKELDRRIAAPLTGGARFVPVLSRKGGVGKTTVTTLLGMALADARDDRVIAVDANPDRGTLAERISRMSGKTVRDLVRARGDVVGFNDLSSIVARDETRLDVVASDTDPRVSEAFSDRDYREVAQLAAHYYSIVLTDTGTGIVHSVMDATLEMADQLVIVSGLSVDEARLASETLTWLETNGYATKVRNAVVVLNNSRPGTPLVRPEELESHFRTRVRTVVRIPYDPHVAAGSAIAFRDLQSDTQRAARELAATVVEGLRALASAA